MTCLHPILWRCSGDIKDCGPSYLVCSLQGHVDLENGRLTVQVAGMVSRQQATQCSVLKQAHTPAWRRATLRSLSAPDSEILPYSALT
jgi:hypothetical protein